MFTIISLYHYHDFLKVIHQAKIMMKSILSIKLLKYSILLDEKDYTFTDYEKFIDKLKSLKVDDIISVFIYDKKYDKNMICINNVRPPETFCDMLIRIEQNLYKDHERNIHDFIVNFDIKYAHISSIDDAFYAMGYHGGYNLVNIYPYEYSSLWYHACDEKNLTVGEKLRLIYPVNFINQNHLACIINQKTLKEHIAENNLGEMQELSKNMFIWFVKDNELEEMNGYFGNYGFLVSWKNPNEGKPKNKRKLP